MEPIISPLWIYLIHLVGMIYDVSCVVLIISIIGLVWFVFACALNGLDLSDLDSEEEKKRVIKMGKICIITMSVSAFMLVIIPDRKTLYEMLAASLITPDNISGVEDHVVDLIKKISNAVCNAK